MGVSNFPAPKMQTIRFPGNGRHDLTTIIPSCIPIAAMAAVRISVNGYFPEIFINLLVQFERLPKCI